MPINLRLDYLSKTIKLFWNSFLAVVIMFLGGVLLFNYNGVEVDVLSIFTHIMVWGVLLLPLSFIWAIWSREKGFKFPLVTGVHVAIIFAALLLTVFILPNDFGRGFREWEMYSVVLLPLVLYAGMHTFLPVNWFKNSTWWAYLRQFSDAASYASVIFLGLFIGITIAIAAMTSLLRSNFSAGGVASIYLFLFCAIYVPLFLTQVTHRLHEEKGREVAQIAPLTKGLVKFLLLPLVAIYDLIVYLYLIQIALNGELPSNTIVPLILLFVAPTYLATVMIFPRLVEYGGRVRTVFRLMHASLIPIMLFYFYAIGLRISEFGLTPDRFLILILGAWVILTSLYFVVGIGKFFSLGLTVNALLLITLIAVYFPFINIFTISSADQSGRIVRQLTNAGVIKNGKISSDTKKFKYDEYSRVQSAVSYLYSTQNEWVLKPYLTDFQYKQLTDTKSAYAFFDQFSTMAGVTYDSGFNPVTPPPTSAVKRLSIYPQLSHPLERLNAPLQLGGYTYAISPKSSTTREALTDKAMYFISFDYLGKQIQLNVGPQLNTAIQAASKTGSTNVSVSLANTYFDFEVVEEGKTYRVLIKRIGAEIATDKVFITSVESLVLGK